MEKKMYNRPATAVTTVEAITAIVCATQSTGGNDPIVPGPPTPPEGGGDAPARYPQF